MNECIWYYVHDCSGDNFGMVSTYHSWVRRTEITFLCCSLYFFPMKSTFYVHINIAKCHHQSFAFISNGLNYGHGTVIRSNGPVLKALPPSSASVAKWQRLHLVAPRQLPDVFLGKGDFSWGRGWKSQALQWGFSNLWQLFCWRRLENIQVRSSSLTGSSGSSGAEHHWSEPPYTLVSPPASEYLPLTISSDIYHQNDWCMFKETFWTDTIPRGK